MKHSSANVKSIRYMFSMKGFKWLCPSSCAPHSINLSAPLVTFLYTALSGCLYKNLIYIYYGIQQFNFWVYITTKFNLIFKEMFIHSLHNISIHNSSKCRSNLITYSYVVSPIIKRWYYSAFERTDIWKWTKIFMSIEVIMMSEVNMKMLYT